MFSQYAEDCKAKGVENIGFVKWKAKYHQDNINRVKN